MHDGAASAGGGDLDLLQHVGTTLTLIEAAGSRSVVKWTTSEVDDALQWAALVESGLDSLPPQFDASSVVASALSSWCEQQQQQQQCGQRWVRTVDALRTALGVVPPPQLAARAGTSVIAYIVDERLGRGLRSRRVWTSQRSQRCRRHAR